MPDGMAAQRDRSSTVGDWTTEEASAAALDRVVMSSGLFRVYEEVEGVLTQPRPEQLSKTLRIDRILVPTERLSSLGWAYGAVGVEIKRSGIRIGPALAQSMDYVRGVWTVRGVLIHLGAVFVWPCEEQFGPLASLMVHNRVGTVTPSAHDVASACFRLGQETALRIVHGEAISQYSGKPMVGNGRSGRKVGSRG